MKKEHGLLPVDKVLLVTMAVATLVTLVIVAMIGGCESRDQSTSFDLERIAYYMKTHEITLVRNSDGTQPIVFIRDTSLIGAIRRHNREHHPWLCRSANVRSPFEAPPVPKGVVVRYYRIKDGSS